MSTRTPCGSSPGWAPRHLALLDDDTLYDPARHLSAVASRHPHTDTHEPTRMAS